MELPPFTLPEVVGRWQFAPVVTGFVVVAAGLYLWGVLRVRRERELAVRVEGGPEGRGAGPVGGVGGGERAVLRAGVGEGGRGGEVGVEIGRAHV